jgi:transcription elongation factor Elf1
MQKPLGMRKTRMGKRICVHRVPLDTTWFCPYCCATVDTAFATLKVTGKGGLSFLRSLAEGGASTPVQIDEVDVTDQARASA